MINNEWQEWQKKQIRNKKVKEWTSEFRRADGNQDEWKKVYRAYLQSDIWKEIRSQVLSRANGRCEKCKVILLDPDVHHLNYHRVGGNERMEDLMVLCFSCHREADKERDTETNERQKDAYYEARLDGFASRKYGDTWWFEHEKQDVEIEFIKFLYKKHCQEYGFDFDPHLDPETDLDFIDFWNDVLNGRA
jgi:5-methylcytosine-specific restriction endonuclease McrA